MKKIYFLGEKEEIRLLLNSRSQNKPKEFKNLIEAKISLIPQLEFQFWLLWLLYEFTK